MRYNGVLHYFIIEKNKKSVWVGETIIRLKEGYFQVCIDQIFEVFPFYDLQEKRKNFFAKERISSRNENEMKVMKNRWKDRKNIERRNLASLKYS